MLAFSAGLYRSAGRGHYIHGCVLKFKGNPEISNMKALGMGTGN